MGEALGAYGRGVVRVLDPDTPPRVEDPPPTWHFDVPERLRRLLCQDLGMNEESPVERRQDDDSMEVRDNTAEHRYEVFDDGELIGFTVYEERDGRLWFVHTEIDDAHQGSGAGSFLVRRAMDDVRARDVKIVPTCPYVAAWIRSRPEYEDLVDTETLREYKRSRGRRVPPGTTVSEPCEHVPAELAQRITPWPLDGCAECLAADRRDWVHLRLCHYCGHVGCCDNSPGRHGSAHAALTGHPLVRSYERDENWWYCFVDERLFEVAGAPRAPSAP